MTLERWVDLSKWQGDVPGQSLRAMKSDGINGICVGAWHGISPNPYVRSVLRRSRDVGLDTATYYVFNSRPGRETVERAITACGQEEWDRCVFHAPDVEIRGITAAILRDGIAATVTAGGWPIIYTGNWFWNWWKLDLGHAPDFRATPSWIAVYNGRPDLAVTPASGLGPLKIHQYTGSTQAYGTTVDFNVADKAWMDAARRRFQPPPAPEPEPPTEEDLMGKIADQMHATGLEIERQMAAATQGATGPRGPQGPKGDTGPMGPPGPAGGGTAQRTYTVKSGDTLGGIANKYDGVTWRQIYDANKATIGGDPDLIQPGMVLVIP